MPSIKPFASQFDNGNISEMINGTKTPRIENIVIISGVWQIQINSVVLFIYINARYTKYEIMQTETTETATIEITESYFGNSLKE